MSAVPIVPLVLAISGLLAPARTPSDAGIFAILTEANMAEIDAAKTALSKTKNADVKAFAREMIADHTELRDAVRALADTLHVRRQTPANDSLAAHVQQERQLLASVSGTTFDKAYMDAQVQDHQIVLTMLSQLEGQAQDARLRALIAGAGPVVRRHLARAQALDQKITANQT